jgi:hypothetical protein
MLCIGFCYVESRRWLCLAWRLVAVFCWPPRQPAPLISGSTSGGSDLGAGEPVNEAGGGEMEYDGQEAGIGASAGMEGDTGRSGQR